MKSTSKNIPFCDYKIPFCDYKIPFCDYKAIFAFDLLFRRPKKFLVGPKAELSFDRFDQQHIIVVS